jgi:RimJ/RimL family protein N-acetyltransferase
MQIETERLLIRTIQPSDWQRMQQIWRDFNESPYVRYDVPHPVEAEAVRQQVERWVKKSQEGMEHRFFVACQNETVIGFVAFHQRKESYEVSYAFSSHSQGNGYARETLSALLNAYRKLGVTRLTAGTALKNRPSVALLNALGFSQVGTEQRSFHQNEDGLPFQFQGGIFLLKLNEKYESPGKMENCS